MVMGVSKGFVGVSLKERTHRSNTGTLVEFEKGKQPISHCSRANEQTLSVRCNFLSRGGNDIPLLKSKLVNLRAPVGVPLKPALPLEQGQLPFVVGHKSSPLAQQSHKAYKIESREGR